jgi:hypothetical protein
MSAISRFSRMNRALDRLRTCAAVLAWSTIFYSVSAAEPPRLTAKLVTGGSDVRLELHGTTGTNYVIESSADLKAWTRVVDGPPQNGILAAELSLVSGGTKRFFRGRETGGATVAFPTNVVVNANTNLSVTTLVTTNGGSAVLYAPNGTQFTFTVPPLTLPEPQLITLTLVTNIGGLPFAGGLLGAVRLEPEGLELWGAGALRISLSPAVDRRKIVSFGANSDGTEFYLTPDRVTTNGIVIPVTQLALYGSAVAERSELSAASVVSVADLNALDTDMTPEGHLPELRRASINLNDCFPERTEIARLIGRNLTRNMRSMSQDLASLLAEARQNQLLGVTEDTFDSGDLLNAGEDASCQFMRTQIQPYFAEAAQNCELMKVLLVKVLGIERQRQLIGAEPNPACASAFRDFPLCAALQNCLKEIEICCLGGRKGPMKVAAIHALARQDQLLGTGCLSSSAIDQAVQACTSNAWTGTIVFTANAEKTDTISDGRVTQVTIERYGAQFTGQVWESQELIFPGFGGTVTLRVRGTVTYDDYYNQTTDVEGECGGSHSIDESRSVAAGESWYRVDINLNEGGTYSLLAAHGDSATGMPGAHANSTDSYFRRSGRKELTDRGSECVSSVESRTLNSIDVALLPPLAFFTGRTDGTNVTGNASIEKFITDPPTDGRYQWDFQRHRAE